MTEVELHIVNAHALEPGKIYILEVDRTKISEENLRGILKYLSAHHIDGVVVRSFGGDGLRIVEPVKELQP